MALGQTLRNYGICTPFDEQYMSGTSNDSSTTSSALDLSRPRKRRKRSGMIDSHQRVRARSRRSNQAAHRLHNALRAQRVLLRDNANLQQQVDDLQAQIDAFDNVGSELIIKRCKRLTQIIRDLMSLVKTNREEYQRQNSNRSTRPFLLKEDKVRQVGYPMRS